MIKVIDVANNIYNNATKALIIDIFRSDITTQQNIIDDGSCYPNKDNGTRSYTIFPYSKEEHKTTITYNNYCVENALSYDNYVLINNKGELKRSFNNELNTNQLILVSDNITISIFEQTSSNMYNFTGYIKQSFASNYNNINNTVISADFIDSEKTFRYDMTITKENDLSKTLNFYYPEYGYVTSNITNITKNVLETDEIEIKYSSGYNNGSCIFTKKEIGTKDFNCKKK